MAKESEAHLWAPIVQWLGTDLRAKKLHQMQSLLQMQTGLGPRNQAHNWLSTTSLWHKLSKVKMLDATDLANRVFNFLLKTIA